MYWFISGVLDKSRVAYLVIPFFFRKFVVVTILKNLYFKNFKELNLLLFLWQFS